MAWFQTGFASGFGQAARGQHGLASEAQQFQGKNDGERSVLGERNNQQNFPRNVQGKVGLLEGTKQRYNQENSYGENIPQGKHRKESRRPPLGGTTSSIISLVTGGFRQTSTKPAWEDIDGETNDVLECTSLANDIMANMFLAEKTKLPSAEYMEMGQPDISPEMRSILIDWLVEVAQEYRLAQETLHLSVRLIDRFLSRQAVARNRLQLVGVTCMFIASKFEEIYAPQVEDFSYITEETFSKQEIVDFERIVLLTLDFELTTPTLRLFLSRVLKAARVGLAPQQLDGRLEALSCYIAELSLLEYASLKALPSAIAAASVMLAQFCLFKTCWSPTLQHYSTYTPPALRQTVHYLYGLYRNARTNPLPAVREKYSHPKYLCIARADPPPELPESLFYPLHVL